MTLNIENPTDDLHYIIGRYERPQEGGWGGGGSVRMMKIDNNLYFYNTEQKYDLLDLWFYFYEKGEMVWNDTLKCFDPTSNLTEIISAVFSIDHTASEMMKNSFISDISHGYDWHNINYYNISYNISGSSNPKLIILHFDIDFNEHIIHLFREILYGNNMGRYYSIITLNENEKKVMNSLYFSIAISDEENNRVTSDVIRVIL